MKDRAAVSHLLICPVPGRYLLLLPLQQRLSPQQLLLWMLEKQSLLMVVQVLVLVLVVGVLVVGVLVVGVLVVVVVEVVLISLGPRLLLSYLLPFQTTGS